MPNPLPYNGKTVYLPYRQATLHPDNPMKAKIIATYILTAVCTCTTAQRQCVVTDAETGVPLRDVLIYPNGEKSRHITTDWGGHFNIPDTAFSLTLCHSKYEKLAIAVADVTDTIALLPNMRRLNEVVVTGHRPQVNPAIMSGIKEAAKAGVQPKTGFNLDFFEIFNFKKRKKQRRRREALANYDAAPSADPKRNGTVRHR